MLRILLTIRIIEVQNTVLSYDIYVCIMMYDDNNAIIKEL
jgi:hypothetical protein